LLGKLLTSSSKVIELKEGGLPHFEISSDLHDNTAAKESESEPNEKHAPDDQSTRPLDPIHWFGVLVPPSLRKAQKSFTDVVTVSVPNILNLSSQMRKLEMEIGRTRKTIKRREKTIDSDISPAVSPS
jgi:hypothetical protein